MAEKRVSFKVVVEEHDDGFVAYPLGLIKGVVVGEGDTKERTLSDLRSAIRFHLQTFGPAELIPDLAQVKASLEDATISV